MSYTQSQAKDFIAKIAPLMKTESQKRGYKICSTAIAQAIIEGASGTSKLAKNYNNHWGLKCGSSWKGKSVNLSTKEEYTVGTLTTIKDNFRVYDSMADGVAGYYDFISTKRYSNLKIATTYTEYAQMLKADGYATSSSYVLTLCNTVKKYNLTIWDSDSATVSVNDTPTLTIGSRNDYVLHVQKYLASLGYQVGAIDGIYGQRTASCVKQYQNDYNLKHSDKIAVDGIWGKQCWQSVGK